MSLGDFKWKYEMKDMWRIQGITWAGERHVSYKRDFNFFGCKQRSNHKYQYAQDINYFHLKAKLFLTIIITMFTILLFNSLKFLL